MANKPILSSHKCRKEIFATQIQRIGFYDDLSSNKQSKETIVALFTDVGEIKIDKAYYLLHSPHVGGYYVEDKEKKLFITEEVFNLFTN